MNSMIIITILLAIWNSILFYEKDLGLSVILFMIPLLLVIYKVLKDGYKINNKKALFIMVPILLLSLEYFIYDSIFNYLNVIVIPMLIVIMIILTVRKKNANNYFIEVLKIFFKPLSKIGDVFKKVEEFIKEKFHLKESTVKNIKSLCIIAPIVIIILFLLGSADMEFGNIFDILFTNIKKFLGNFGDVDFYERLISIVILAFYMGATFIYISKYYDEDKIKSKDKKKDARTVKMLYIILIVIYSIFDIYQVKSLVLHRVSFNISYAEYARQGFFQLMIVSIINLVILIKTRCVYNKDNNFKYYAILILCLTVIIILSSIYRMYLYESSYGYTILRLLVYVVLITELILMIPTVMYIIKDNYNIAKSYFVIVVVIYVTINFANFDKIIAIRNIDRYYKTEDIDLEYLMNYRADNYFELRKLYGHIDDYDMKQELGDYLEFTRFKNQFMTFQEFNYSKYEVSK